MTTASKLIWPAAVAALLAAGAPAFAQGGAGQGGLSADTPVLAPTPPGPSGAGAPAPSGPRTPLPPRDTPRAAQPGQGGGDGPKTPLPPRDTPRAAQPGQHAAPKDADWPCVQVKVPEMSWGQMWSGPSLDTAFKSWRNDEEVAALVSTLASRRTKIEDAKTRIDDFAGELEGGAEAKLTELFAGVFESLNDERSRIMTGIERFARKQRDLSERIKRESLKIAEEQKDMASQATPEAAREREALDWDTRIYDERQQSLTYVCESPILLEQRAFEIGREIQAHLTPAAK